MAKKFREEDVDCPAFFAEEGGWSEEEDECQLCEEEYPEVYMRCKERTIKIRNDEEPDESEDDAEYEEVDSDENVVDDDEPEEEPTEGIEIVVGTESEGDVEVITEDSGNEENEPEEVLDDSDDKPESEEMLDKAMTPLRYKGSKKINFAGYARQMISAGLDEEDIRLVLKDCYTSENGMTEKKASKRAYKVWFQALTDLGKEKEPPEESSKEEPKDIEEETSEQEETPVVETTTFDPQIVTDILNILDKAVKDIHKLIDNAVGEE